MTIAKIVSIALFRNEIVHKFGLSGFSEIQLEVNDNAIGTIKINSIEIDSFPWIGIYFNDIPISIEAIPKEGYKFKKWSGFSSETSKVIVVEPKKSIELKAIFD